MSSNKKESIFWALAKETGVIDTSESSSMLNEAEELLKDTQHFTENACIIREQIYALREKKRKLELDRTNFSHQKRLTLFKRKYDEGLSEIAKIKVELEFALRRNNLILHLLQTASKTRDSLPIPIQLQEKFITIIKDLVKVTSMKGESIECFKELSKVYSDLQNMLKGMFPMKQQVLRNISLYNSVLYNIIELDKEIGDLSVFLSICAISILEDTESDSMNL